MKETTTVKTDLYGRSRQARLKATGLVANSLLVRERSRLKFEKWRQFMEL